MRILTGACREKTGIKQSLRQTASLESSKVLKLAFHCITCRRPLPDETATTLFCKKCQQQNVSALNIAIQRTVGVGAKIEEDWDCRPPTRLSRGKWS